MKTYETELDPITNSSIKIKLFRKVQNVPELRKQIIAGELQLCVIKPTLIVDPFQIIVAANKALVAEKQDRMITRTIFSEILFSLSISKNVSKSLPQFGIDDKYSDIIVVAICRNGTNSDDIFQAIDGEEREIDEISDITDFKAVKKAYNISADEEKCSNLLDSIVNKIVIKDI